MIKEPLVSIIIPTYNRANLLGETLTSILSQSYKIWECIIIDDGSTENNVEIINGFMANDLRFKLFERKNFNKPKGANACRNIGLEKSTGDYLIFFDSDDIMHDNHIEVKLNNIVKSNSDIVVFKSQYFNNPNNTNPINYRGLFELEINSENYITQKINWITFDPIIRSSVAKQVSFNEALQANQEYNYFSKLLFYVKESNARDIILTDRRYDERSIQGSLAKKNAYIEKAFLSFFHTYKEVVSKASKPSKQFLLIKLTELAYRDKSLLKSKRTYLYSQLIKNIGLLKAFNTIRLLELKK